MGIFDRLTRLARAEVGHLRERIRQAVDPADAKAGGDRSDPGASRRDDGEPEIIDAEYVEIDPAPGEGDAPRHDPYAWPRDVRQAYATLEVPLGSDRETVRRAYRDLMKRHHPDRHQASDAAEDAATERTLAIKAAWERVDEFLGRREG